MAWPTMRMAAIAAQNPNRNSESRSNEVALVTRFDLWVRSATSMSFRPVTRARSSGTLQVRLPAAAARMH